MIVRINDKQIYRGKNEVLEVFHAAIESGEKHVELLTDNYERIIEVVRQGKKNMNYIQEGGR